MKFENLYEGQVFKNYKEMCEVLEIKPTTGGAKQAQFKELDTYCEYSKQGHKIIVDTVFETPRQKVDGRSSDYREMRNLILRLLALSNQERNRAIFPTSTLLQGLGAINSNYATGRRQQKALGRHLDIETEYVNDFYNTTHTNLKNALETNLNYLKNERLITWGNTIMVCKNNPKVKLNALGEYVLDEDGRIISEDHQDFRVATVDEKEFIIKTEKEILSNLGYKTIAEVFKHGCVKSFYDTVYSILKRECNINFYFMAYEIIFSREIIEKELERTGGSIQKEKELLNARVKDKIIFNAEKRNEKAKHMVSSKQTIQTRKAEEYIGNIRKILDTVIDMSAKNITLKLKPTDEE